MNQNYDDYSEMPAGLRMALTKNLKALNHFASLTHAQQQAFMQGAHHISSSEEMEDYVSRL